MSKEIKLTRGYVALVDDEDYEAASAFKWYANVQRNTVYALRDVGRHGTPERKSIRLHRFVLGLGCSREPIVDHIDGNGLNCRKGNLRQCEHRDNIHACRKPRHGLSSPYKGVTFDKSRGKWIASISPGRKHKHLGRFATQEQAAAAYDQAAAKYFGDYARLNLG